MAYMSQHNEPATVNTLGEIVLANGELSKRTFRRALYELQDEGLLRRIQHRGEYIFMRTCDIGDI